VFFAKVENNNHIIIIIILKNNRNIIETILYTNRERIKQKRKTDDILNSILAMMMIHPLDSMIFVCIDVN